MGVPSHASTAALARALRVCRGVRAGASGHARAAHEL